MINWKIEFITDADGDWKIEKFPKGHKAEGKIRARYLIKPSQSYLDKLEQQRLDAPKTPEEIKAEQIAYLKTATLEQKVDFLLEQKGLK